MNGAKITTLTIGPMRTFTLRAGPSRFMMTGKPAPRPGDILFEIRRKPRHRWWAEFAAWHLWGRWRKQRIVIGSPPSTPVGRLR